MADRARRGPKTKARLEMDTTTQPDDTSGRLTQGLRNLVDEAEQVLHGAVNSGDAKFDAMRLQLAQHLKRLRLQVDELEASATRKARLAARAADETVHAHPYGAMGLAAAIGLLIGALVARR
jgi:ElaB/YqjD/DUF883 family membrane-anchored ribosome-binding protein